MNHQQYIGSLQQFMPLPSGTFYRQRTLSQNITRNQVSQPRTRRQGFNLHHHLKKMDNTALVKVIKQRGMTDSRSRDQKKRISRTVDSIVGRIAHTDLNFFTKAFNQKDQISKNKLNKRHQLLKSIVRAQEQQNKFKGSSMYDQSFKRLYNQLSKVQVEPIPNQQPVTIDDTYMLEETLQNTTKGFQERKQPIPPKLRLRLQTCRKWAKRHHKSTSYYNKQLGDTSHLPVSKDTSVEQRENRLFSIKQILK